jgi:hypothetical protein
MQPGAGAWIDVLGFRVDLRAYEAAAGELERLAALCAASDPERADRYLHAARSIREDVAWMVHGARGFAPSLRRRLGVAP